MREEIELFSQAVLPSLLGYVSEAAFNIIIGFAWPGLGTDACAHCSQDKDWAGFLLCFSVRAEIVKEAGQADERDWQQWVEKFDELFDILEPILSDTFPGTINTGEDMYVWHFGSCGYWREP